MIRIITGSARGVKLETLAGEATRPTAERVKEAVFSMLQFSLEGRRVLDLFAGSGQLGLEAVSRGAERAVLVDAARDAIGVITKNAARTRLSDKTEIVQRDALAFLSSPVVKPFHLVFLDPPYALGLVPQCLSLLLSRGWLTAGALIVAETKEEGDVFSGDAALCAQFDILKKSRYGAAHITILSKRENTI
jgi:16S rRNA (guanine(966)-N(2))-methyltransferase RsmD